MGHDHLIATTVQAEKSPGPIQINDFRNRQAIDPPADFWKNT